MLRYSLFFFLPFTCFSQNAAVESYISKFKDAAMHNMTVKKIPASITLAQGILESGAGLSDLATLANNHFGIKCHKGWTGETYRKDDDTVNECFRKYPNVEASYADHADFLRSRTRYASLFTLDIKDYKGWAYGLKQAGYATLPTYPEKLIGYIEKYKLHQYDSLALMSSVPNKSDQSIHMTENKETIQKTPAVDAKTPAHIEKNIENIQGSNTETAKGNSRHTGINNGCKYLTAKKGDTPESLSIETGLAIWQIKRYNELRDTDLIQSGDLIYLQPKQSMNSEFSIHLVSEGETARQIAARYAIKIQSLLELNGIKEEDVKSGITLRLN
jgi:LysM repeat protein